MSDSSQSHTNFKVSPIKIVESREGPYSFAAQIIFFFILIAIVGLGIFLRCKGVSTLSLWLDETHVANALSSGGGFDKYFKPPIAHRPLLYLMLSEILLNIHNTELFARLTSIIPSLLTLLLIVPLSLKVFTNRASVIASVFLLAVNPYLIDTSKDFKPYAMEHFICLLMLYFVVSWWKEGQPKYIYYYCLAAIISPMLGHPFIFVIPSFSLVLIYELYSSKAGHLKWLVLGATVIAVSWYVGIYYFGIRHLDTSKVTTFDENLFQWNGLGQALTWGGGHIWSMFTKFFPGKNFVGYDVVFDAIVKVFVSVGMVAVLIKSILSKEWKLLAVIFLTLLLSFAVSVLFAWPFGVARTNIYYISYIAFIVIYGIDYLLSNIENKYLHHIIILILLIFMFPYDTSFYNYKHEIYWTPAEEFSKCTDCLIKYIDETNYNNDHTDKPLIIFNAAADSQFKYYTEHHSLLSQRYKSFFSKFDVKFLKSRDQNVINKSIADYLTKNDSVFFMFSHYQPQEIQSLLSMIYSPYVRINMEQHFPQASLVNVSFRRR